MCLIETPAILPISQALNFVAQPRCKFVGLYPESFEGTPIYIVHVLAVVRIKWFDAGVLVAISLNHQKIPWSRHGLGCVVLMLVGMYIITETESFFNSGIRLRQ